MNENTHKILIQSFGISLHQAALKYCMEKSKKCLQFMNDDYLSTHEDHLINLRMTNNVNASWTKPMH